MSTISNTILKENEIVEGQTSLNPTLTDYLTDLYNTTGRKLTDGERKYVERYYRIHILSGRAVCVGDFKGIMSKESFRQYRLRLQDLIEVEIHSNPKFYKLKGIYINNDLTVRYSYLDSTQRMHADLDIKMSMVSHEKPLIHNIRLNFKTDSLYEKLLESGHTPHKQNKFFTFTMENPYPITINVYPTNSVSVIVKCTYSPIEYSQEGFLLLSCTMGEVLAYLKIMAKFDFIHEPITNWRFIHFDFNRDSLSFDCDYPLHIVMGHVQMYSKTMPDKKTVFRVEDQVQPKTSFSVEFQKASKING